MIINCTRRHLLYAFTAPRKLSPCHIHLLLPYFDCIALGIHYHISCLFAHMQCAMSMMKFIAFFLAYSHSTLHSLFYCTTHGTARNNTTRRCSFAIAPFEYWNEMHNDHKLIFFLVLSFEPSACVFHQAGCLLVRLKRNKNFTIYGNYKFFTHSVLNRLNRDYAELDISSFISRRTIASLMWY